jgi:O-antigen ligase
MAAALPLIEAMSPFGDAAQKAGIVAVALLAAGAVLAPRARTRAWTMLGALVLTPVLLLTQIWNTAQLHTLRDRPALALGAAVVALAVVAVAAWLVHRRPALLALGAAFTLPFRIPIAVGGSTSNLLVPLYLVVAAGALAYLVPRLRENDQVEAPAGRMEKALMVFVVLYAAQAAYSADFNHALEQVVFFYVPFALLFALLARLDWTPRLVARCLGVMVGLALLFVGVGFVEYATKHLFLNPKVIASNQFESYFRVNSLFFDPNIYGRFLAIVMLGVAAAVVWTRRTRDVVIGAALLGILWAGLVVTFSQSSFGAVLVGLAVLAGLRWNVRKTLAVCAVAVAAGAAFVAIAPGALHLKLGNARSASSATSGRTDLLSGGARLFRDRPVLGWGSGSFSREYRRHEHASTERAASASHTIPVTVAAEQGLAGLAVYLALLVLAFARLFRNAPLSVERAAVAAGFVALVFHTLLYAAFLEDPLAWALLGVGVALARRATALRGRDA